MPEGAANKMWKAGKQEPDLDYRPGSRVHGFRVVPGLRFPDLAGVGARFLRRLAQLPAQALLGLVWLYQRGVSPVLPAVFGPNCGCRFSPTCSHYAAEAVRTRGALVGTGLTLWRLLRCTPLSAGGFDPVPPSPRLRRAGPSHRPTCARVGAPAA